ncbi:transcriptional regulator [Streptantibioticus parmotrematis]|uniref:transcriptional regulator n=1 Tax=Streptantibioticus parmotrematis TaxID=2873249 RepID=UPI0033DA4B58
MLAAATTDRHPLAQVVALLGGTGVDFIRKVAREHQALGYGSLAARKEQYSRWTSATRPITPHLHTQLAMAHLLRVEPAQVDAFGWPAWLLLALRDGSAVWTSPWTPAGTIHALDHAGGSVDRRAFLTATATTTAAVLAQWATAARTTTAAASSGRRIGTSVTDAVDSRLTALRHLDDDLGSGHVYTIARAELDLITTLLKNNSYNEATGRRLYAAASEAARLTGWCAYDSHHIGAAEELFAAALRSSASAGRSDAGLIAWAFWANTRYACGDPRGALDMVDGALATAGTTGTPRTLALLHLRRARALSLLDQPTDAYHAIDTALASYTKAESPAADSPVLYWVNEGEIHEAAASSALDLGEPKRALAFFDAAATAQDPYDPDREPRGTAVYQARIASAHLALGDLDAALDAARTAATHMGGVDSTRGNSTLTDLRESFARHRCVPGVKDFLDDTAP